MELSIGALLGEGTYGKVYRILGQELAMKQMNITTNGIPELKELSLLRIVNHPNVMHLVSFKITPIYVGLIMPLATTDLGGEILIAVDYDRDPEIKRWMYELLSAIHFLHKHSYYHCDIKPNNVLLITNGSDGTRKAVLSDLGLTGNVMNIGACQTYASPQRHFQNGEEMKSPLSLLPSNEYQDDVWALGVTFFYMVTGDYSVFSEPDDIDAYAGGDSTMQFVKDEVEDQYIPLLNRLLNPDPAARSFNLLQLLALPIFSEHHDYVDGTIVNTPNEYPVIFDASVVVFFKNAITTLRETFKINITVGDPLPYIMLFNSIDLLYRIYTRLKLRDADTSIQIRAFIACCFYISAKIFGLFYVEDLKFPTINKPEMITVEPIIVGMLNGFWAHVLSLILKSVGEMCTCLEKHTDIFQLLKNQCFQI